MLIIEGNIIKITRGDTLTLTVGMTKDGQTYTPTEGEVVRFALSKGEEKKEILTIARHYFVKPPAGLGGNWYMTSIFKGWCDEHKLEPDWFKSE